MSDSAHRVSNPVFPLLLIAAAVLPYFINIGGPSLWDANEAFYAETPREMLVSDDYLAPAFNFQPRTQKPPLTYWAVLACYRLFGVNEFSVRLPGALAILGTILFVYGMARRLYSERAAIVAVVLAAATPRLFALARKLPIDTLLIFWMTGTAYFLIRALRDHSSRAWFGACLFAGFGFLTKGPVALAIPALSVLAWGVLNRPFRVRISWLVGGAAVLGAVILPWYAAVYHRHGWTYIAGFFLRDNLSRFATESFGPSRGPLFYGPTYLADFFPWSILSVSTLLQLWRDRKEVHTRDAVAYSFPLIWCVVVFVLFSLSRNKQEYYIAPLYPVMAALVSGVLVRTLRSDRMSEQMRAGNAWTYGVMAVSAALLGASIFSVFALRSFLPDASAVIHYGAPVILLAAAVAPAWNVARGRNGAAIAVLAAALWLVYILVPLLYLPALEPLRPVKDLCRTIETHAQPGDETGYYRATVPSMVFYLRRPIFEEFDADAMVRRFQSGQRVFCILTERDHNYFVGSRDQILYVVDQRPRLVTRLRSLFDDLSWADEELVLVSNRPAGESLQFNRTRGDR
jgi:4-amino-4-deoxy-L-arabinose transferase-like glycosyltransferase